MENKANELRALILERSEILRWFSKYQPWFSASAFRTLSTELRDWKIELAVIENAIQELEYKMISNN